MRPGQGGGPYFESMQALAPIIFLILFGIVAIAAFRGCVDRAKDPEAERFDAVREFSRINSRGMVQVIRQRGGTEKRSEPDESY